MTPKKAFDPGVLLEDIINDAKGAESGKLEMTGEGLRDVQRVYWSLSALEASPADYRRLLADMAMEAIKESDLCAAATRSASGSDF